MRRAATKQSPSPCAGAKQLIAWIKERGICAACGAEGGVIAHHVAGSSAKVRVGLERAYIGPWFGNGLCSNCDGVVTYCTRREFRTRYGRECDVWARQIEEYEAGTGAEVPELIKQGVAEWGK